MNPLLLTFALFAGPVPASLPFQEPPTGEEAEEAAPAAEEPAEAPAEEAAESAEESPWLAVVGGDVHTVTRGVIPEGTVLCRDGRIVAVGRDVRIPEGARVLRVDGMQVYPGLVAADSRGFVRGRGRDAVDSFDPFSLQVDLALTGGLTTVFGSGMVVKLTRGSLEGYAVRVAPFVTLNVSPTSPGGRRAARERFGKARDFLRELSDWQLRKDLGEDVGEAPEPEGVDEDALALLRGEKTARFNADDLKDLIAICEFLEEYPMESVVYGGREAWIVAGRLGRAGVRMVIHARDKRWADPDLNRPSGWSIENARILWEHGVEFAIVPAQASVSTMGIMGRDLMTLPIEADFAIRGGLPQEAALEAITLDAAKILGVDHRLGSIEPGKDADLVICDGDLFHYRTFVQWTVVDGRVVYDKQERPYFAHVRPRPEIAPEEALQALEEALSGDGDEAVVPDESGPGEGAAGGADGEAEHGAEAERPAGSGS